MGADAFRLPPALAAAGFSLIRPNVNRRLIVNSRGHDKCGKTYWACRAPSPICYINTDQGQEGVLDELVRKGLTCGAQFDVILKPGRKKDEYEKTWDKFEAAFKTACESKVFRTIVIDTHTELWALLRLARFGKLSQVLPEHYAPVNSEFEEFTNYPKQFQGLNAVYIHKMSKEYKGGKDASGKKERSEWTGNYERRGYNGMDYIAAVNLEHFRYTRMDETRGFGIRVLNNRLNPECDGLEFTDELDTSFAFLATQLFPDTTEDDWK